MPVPVWDCSDLDLLDEPLDTANMVSDDIWKKFDLDFPLEHSDAYHEQRTFDDGVIPDLLYNKMTCLASREIRHHDCMWAGLCISKEHNRTLPAKRDSQIQKKIPAGRSLLISRASAAQTMNSLRAGQQQAQQMYRAKNLQSDGDSPRPDTPQTSSSDTEAEEEAPFFRHDQINLHEKLYECMSEMITRAVPVSEVTGQLARFHDRRKEEENQCQVHRETNIRNTLSDHCYHLHHPLSKSLEHLGVQTPSDSEEEEIDVVTFEKPCKPVILPTYPNVVEQQHFQVTVNTAFKKTPRPRGRPPNPAKKREIQQQQQQQQEEKPAKRARRRTYTRRTNPVRCATTISPSMSTNSSPSTSRSSSEDELDTEKRSLHNNMERQRRVDLRNAFEDLRLLVPAIQDREKAPKVAILRQAAAYCDKLIDIEQHSEAQVNDLKNIQDNLRSRLRDLRRSLAMTR